MEVAGLTRLMHWRQGANEQWQELARMRTATMSEPVPINSQEERYFFVLGLLGPAQQVSQIPATAWWLEQIVNQQPECMQQVRHHSTMMPNSPFTRNSSIRMEFSETTPDGIFGMDKPSTASRADLADRRAC